METTEPAVIDDATPATSGEADSAIDTVDDLTESPIDAPATEVVADVAEAAADPVLVDDHVVEEASSEDVVADVTQSELPVVVDNLVDTEASNEDGVHDTSAAPDEVAATPELEDILDDISPSAELGAEESENDISDWERDDDDDSSRAGQSETDESEHPDTEDSSVAKSSFDITEAEDKLAIPQTAETVNIVLVEDCHDGASAEHADAKDAADGVTIADDKVSESLDTPETDATVDAPIADAGTEEVTGTDEVQGTEDANISGEDANASASDASVTPEAEPTPIQSNTVDEGDLTPSATDASEAAAVQEVSVDEEPVESVEVAQDDEQLAAIADDVESQSIKAADTEAHLAKVDETPSESCPADATSEASPSSVLEEADLEAPSEPPTSNHTVPDDTLTDPTATEVIPETIEQDVPVASPTLAEGESSSASDMPAKDASEVVRILSSTPRLTSHSLLCLFKTISC
ncbi:BASP1 domain containing protein [Pyrenophora tritici-repentis]|nr:BASP1 domain containing protein [Pyrenophora tritici-repentis]KAI1538326.1 BASP1 domain containing protein [Pyrenophora tritici-repentis]KAI1563732.1 BASP1 domain containing protein [Pyrenophora tritici-repentis]KAI1582982.1 BASP1 domain containing protein [Pyrenophora tritici-repentis]KAI1597078.1 BASP1 domain containing protein [Pyrenophora tritici-repentis]